MRITATALFQAVNQSSHFADLKIYYFHNCFYDQLFTTPSCSWRDKILDRVGLSQPETGIQGNSGWGCVDGAVGTSVPRRGSLDYFHSNERTGIYWLQEMLPAFSVGDLAEPRCGENNWAYAYGAYTISLIREEIPMFPLLTAAGLEAGIKELKINMEKGVSRY